jgi:hypothetical protein
VDGGHLSKKNTVPFISGILLLLLGLVTLWRGHASWYGAGRISGAQAELYAFVCIAFALVFFLLAFAVSARKQI